MKWDENETTRPGGIWCLPEVARTVRMLCPCGHEMRETPETLLHLRRTGHYVPMNPNASPEMVGFWVPRQPAGDWAGLVARFLRGNEERKAGVEDNFKEFLIKDLAESYSVGGSETVEVHASGDYELTDPPHAFEWEDEALSLIHI